MSRKAEFPKYLMKVDGQRKFMSLHEAGVAWDSGLVKVEFGRYVLFEDFGVRKMTPRDKAVISEVADKHSENK